MRTDRTTLNLIPKAKSYPRRKPTTLELPARRTHVPWWIYLFLAAVVRLLLGLFPDHNVNLGAAASRAAAVAYQQLQPLQPIAPARH